MWMKKINRPDQEGDEVEGRIAGGEEPDRGARDAPFQAQISRENAQFCSGAIVNNRTIVTAAHCVENAEPRDLNVRVGSNIRGEGTVVPIQKIVLHPEYDYPQNNFDVAYLRTAMDITFSRTVLRAFLADPVGSVPREVLVTGYGYQGEGQMQLSDKLREVTLPIISNMECQLFYPEKSITKNMICAYSMRDMDKGTCVGDGGDPATVNRRLIGISSFARGCGPGMGPSVFTYVDAPEVREFIMNATSSAQRPGTPSERPELLPEEPSERPELLPEEPSERPDKAPKGPEKPSERPDKAPKGPEKPSERPDKAPKGPEKPSEKPERPSEKPERPSEKPETSERPQRPSKRPMERPQKRPAEREP
ncbi:hypodermin-A-like [Maniola hyperantus]|uniref:hypodermin-A-like n=1 Tax=Aphantopus hyperantus TaxID=2795564 RepID=UPI0037499836